MSILITEPYSPSLIFSEPYEVITSARRKRFPFRETFDHEKFNFAGTFETRTLETLSLRVFKNQKQNRRIGFRMESNEFFYRDHLIRGKRINGKKKGI